MDYNDQNPERNPETHLSYESYANDISSSLEGVNNYTKRRGELPSLLLYFLRSNGENEYKDINIRELYRYILKSINELEKNFDEKKKREKFLAKLTKQNKKKKRRNSFDDIYKSSTLLSPSPLTSPRTKRKSSFNRQSLDSEEDSESEDENESKEDSDSDSELEYYTDIIGDLRLKDLRRLDYQFNSDEEKSIIVKKHCVLFAMDPLRAIVMADEVILVVPAGADSLISMLEQSMRYWRSEEEEVLGIEETEKVAKGIEDETSGLKMPFVLHAYESLLTTLKTLEDNRFNHFNSQIQHVLSQVRSGSLIPLRIQEKLRNLKNDLSNLKNTIISTRQILSNITEDEEEMALMNLYLLKKNPDLYKANESEAADNKIYNGSILTMSPQLLDCHDEIEELLESYLFDFNSLDLKINYTRSQIQSAEEGVSLRLDTSRNDLLLANTALSVLSLGLGFGAYVTGAFGMNLDNTETIQNFTGSFLIVTIVTTVFIIFSFFGILWYLFQSGILPSRGSIKYEGTSKIGHLLYVLGMNKQKLH